MLFKCNLRKGSQLVVSSDPWL